MTNLKDLFRTTQKTLTLPRQLYAQNLITNITLIVSKPTILVATQSVNNQPLTPNIKFSEQQA